jgi:hypothetical protein
MRVRHDRREGRQARRCRSRLGTPQRSAAVTVSPSTTPAFAGDAGDPDVVYSAGTYFAFTTGTPMGNHIQALVSGSPSSGYHSYTGTAYGSTALADPPGWETTNTQTSPGVFDWGGHWLMYYDAAHLRRGAHLPVDRIDRSEPLRRPGVRQGLPRLEAERRRIGQRGDDLVTTAERHRARPRRLPE